MTLQEVIVKLQFIHDDDDDSFSVGWTVQEVLDAQAKAYAKLTNESTGETLDRSDFTDEEWCDWIEEILMEGRS